MPIINLVYEAPEVVTTAGIYHNATLGLISLSSDGQTWITIADKNMGATQAGYDDNVSTYGEYYTASSLPTIPSLYSIGTLSNWDTDIKNIMVSLFGNDMSVNFKQYLLMPRSGFKDSGTLKQNGSYFYTMTNTSYDSAKQYGFRGSDGYSVGQVVLEKTTSAVPIRLIANTPVQPDSSRTKLY